MNVYVPTSCSILKVVPVPEAADAAYPVPPPVHRDDGTRSHRVVGVGATVVHLHAARALPMISTTTKSSISVKPFSSMEA